ncbi:MAG TPA: glycoside hydrolase family 43 protein [Opitutaceae bacterium]|nr:glycoside hydrolase family 43 protein [Opitutaceae bacterium]
MSVLSIPPTGRPMAPEFPRLDARVVPTFQNPIAPGADPWVVWHDGWYYWCLSENMLGVTIHRSRTLTALGEKVAGWRAPRVGPYCAEIWAPELHRIDGRWFVYVAASNGDNATHRMIVLEVAGDHPTGAIEFKAELYTGDDLASGANNRWAIDATPFEHEGRRYLLWSGWADDRDEQWLYIAAMANPWTVASNRVRICANDDFAWERVGESLAQRGLNEAPQVLQRDGRVFVIYSASGSWEVSYKLGLVELRPGGDPLRPTDWIKHHAPVLQATARTWGVGHCSFTRSPDGAEDWIAFHAKRERQPNWDRVIHVQRFDWDDEGRPVFSAPADAGESLAMPSE